MNQLSFLVVLILLILTFGDSSDFKVCDFIDILSDSPRPVLGTTLVLSVTKRLNEPYGYDDDVVNPLMDTNVSPYK